MAQVVTEDTALTWAGEPVEPARIEAELTRLRYGAAGSPPGGESYAMRTSLLNLVVHAVDEEAAREASQTIAGLTRDHPSRALIIIAEPSDEESRIEARCAAHCHIASGLEQQVCCEEVALTVRGRAANHLHSIIIPLLVPDLPVYVWWTGPLPRGHHLFEEMMESADRFIVDSGHFRHPTHGLLRVAELCAETPGCAVGDVNWARMAAWRGLLTQHCEAPDIQAHLQTVTGIEIVYSDGDGTYIPGQAFLLLGWICARLGWDAVAQVEDGGRLSLHHDGKPIAVRFEARAAGLEHGALLAVRLEGVGTSVSVTRTDDPSHVEVSVRTPDYEHRERVPIEDPSASEMLATELDDLPGQSSEYERVLQRALPLIRALDVSH